LSRQDGAVLYQNAPNPFGPKTTIKFDLPRAGHVKLCVYNVKGELVTTIVDGHMGQGRQEVTWTARDGGGAETASGIYFYRLITEDSVETKKMMLLN
jgi:flagellar hook assembly protein FlgD